MLPSVPIPAYLLCVSPADLCISWDFNSGLHISGGFGTYMQTLVCLTPSSMMLLLGSRVFPNSSPTPYSYSWVQTCAFLSYSCHKKVGTAGIPRRCFSPPTPTQCRASCSHVAHAGLQLCVAESDLGLDLPSISQALGLQTSTTRPRNTCFSRMANICRQRVGQCPFLSAWHTTHFRDCSLTQQRPNTREQWRTFLFNTNIH